MSWKSLFGTFASILFGFALGTASAGRLFHFGHHFGPPRPAEFLDHFAKEFQLSENQKTQVGKLFEEQRTKVEALHEEVFPRFESLREETRQKVRAVLTEEQRPRFDEIQAQRDSERKKFFHGPGPHGPGKGFGPPPPL